MSPTDTAVAELMRLAQGAAANYGDRFYEGNPFAALESALRTALAAQAPAGAAERENVIEECLAAIPTNWLDPMLTGPAKVVGVGRNDVEAVLLAIRARILALATQASAPTPQPTDQEQP